MTETEIPEMPEPSHVPFWQYATFCFVGFAGFFVGLILAHFTEVGSIHAAFEPARAIPLDILTATLLYLCALLGLVREKRLTWPTAFTGLLLTSGAFLVSWSAWLVVGR